MEEIEDIVLTLTNDRKAYESTIKWMKQFRDGALNYEEFRTQMRRVINTVIPTHNFTGMGVSQKTTILIARLFEHYRDEVYGNEFSYYNDMLSRMPTWAQKHLEPQQVIIDDPSKKQWGVRHDDQLDACSYVEKYFVRLEDIRMTAQQKLHLLSKDQDTMNPSAAIIVTPPAIEVRTLIFGRDLSQMTDDEVFSAIGNIERQIDDLEKIGSKPQKLVNKIELLKKQVAEIVAAVDAR